MLETTQGTPPTALGVPLSEFVALPPAERARLAGEAVPDLHYFIDGGVDLAQRSAPERTRELAGSLFQHLSASADDRRELAHRIVTDALLREECDRDQNVYLGKVFTRALSSAVPDVLFLPRDAREIAHAFAWARDSGCPVTLRGAASTAMGGAVPGAAGLALDFARLDAIDVDADRETVRFGAGTRMRPLHAALKKKGLALSVYPSNLGGTYAGWFATGGIGMNAFGRGKALDGLHAATVVLPAGEVLRLDADGGVQVFGGEALDSAQAERWFAERSLPKLTLADFAGSEGQFGAIVELEARLEALPVLSAFLFAFPSRDQALAAAQWVRDEVAAGLEKPLDLKVLTGAHLDHVRSVWSEDDARPWREQPGALTAGDDLPWQRVVGPGELGAAVQPEPAGTAAHVFVDFASEPAGRAFAERLAHCPGQPTLLGEESARFTADRFRPQQIKRLGPGFLAAEILLPAAALGVFLPAAERLARRAGTELDAEIYFQDGAEALAISGFLTDHRKGSFRLDLLLAPALLDLAMARCGGRPYVLGRWQANLHGRKFSADERGRLAALKQALDPARLISRGAFFGMGLRPPFGTALSIVMGPSVRLLRYGLIAAKPVISLLRMGLDIVGGPAAGRGASSGEVPLAPGEIPAGAKATGRAIHCVNCGECNSVCPIFQESKIRLPQMLTHLGEAQHAGESGSTTSGSLLDLCMRCGNCEEVCQAGIPHLPLYAEMQKAADVERPRDREKHVLLLEKLRGSRRYTHDFLDIRPGGYEKRTPASLPGSARFVLLRAEGDEGPAETCIHCAACVDVCPTSANREYEGEDPRWITTHQESCIGCGTCVEVCPANQRNGGRTLRVMEAPTQDWFAAFEAYEREESTR